MRILALLIICCFLSCHSHKKSEVEDEVVAQKTPAHNPVIIIDHLEPEQTLYIKNLASLPSLKGTIYPFKMGKDTLILDAKSDIVRISSPQNYTQEVLLQPNDTLRVRFRESVITLENNVAFMDSIIIENEASRKLETTFNKLQTRYFIESDLGMDSMTVQNEYEKILLKGSGGYFNKDLMREEPDSIRQMIDLSRKIYEAKFDLLSNSELFPSYDLNTKKLLQDKAQAAYNSAIHKYGGYLDDTGPIFSNLDIEMATDHATVIDEIIFNEDDPESLVLAKKGFPRDIFENRYAVSHFQKMLNVLQSRYATKGKSRRITKFHQVYEDLPKHFEGEKLHIARAVAIITMMNWNEPWDKIKKSYENYVNTYGSDPFIAGFKHENRAKLGIKNKQSQDLFLSTINDSKKQTTLSEVIKKHKGKSIYVDFWASWCPPCIDNMPASKALETELKNEVVFIYVSIDMSEEKWKAATDRLKLTEENSFIALNANQSDFISSFDIEEIPRYMIYGIDGRLIESNAPPPTDSLLTKRLRSLK
ncbi:MAG: TlpA disulfide reductase family protein [Nonlabens sp.]